MAAKYASVVLVSRFQAELERLFQEALQMGESALPAPGEWQPLVDVVETPDAVVLLAEVPGLAATDLQVEVKGQVVTIAGVKSTPMPGAERPRFQCVERGHGRFRREIQLFWPINSHRGTARLADGLLTVEFPKVEEKRQAARRLHVEEGGDPAR